MAGRSFVRDLGYSDFRAGQPGQIPGRMSTLAALRVPRGTGLALPLGHAFRLQLRGHYATQTASNLDATQVFDLGAAGYPFLAPPRGAAVVVYRDGALITPTAVDADADTVEVPKNADTVHQVDFYMLLEVGDLQLVAASPEGADARQIVLYTDSLRALNETDQADSRTAPRIERPGLMQLPLGPRWEFRLNVHTPAGVQMAWTDEAQQVVRFTAAQTRIQPSDERDIAERIAQLLRS